MVKVSFAVLFLITVVLASGLTVLQQPNCQATSTEDEDWPMFHKNPANTGFTNGSAPKSTPTVLWKTNYSEPGTGSSPPPPVIVDDIVYVMGGLLSAYNATTGENLWRQQDAFYSFPVIDKGIIYTQGQAFNASTGVKLWNITVTFTPSFTTAVADGYFYTIGQDGLVGVNASTGALIWTSNYGSWSASPAILNGYIYFGAGDNIVALDAHTGTQLWRYPIKNYVYSSPAADAGKVYFNCNGALLCLDAITGEKLWNYTSASAYSHIESSPALGYGCVFVGSGDGNVYALNASSGAKVWNYSLGWNVTSSPAIADGVVYVGANDGNLHALNASTGSKLWSYEVGKPQYMWCSPAIANGRIYMGSEDTLTIALETSQSVDNEALNPVFVIIPVVIVVIVGVLLYKKYKPKK